MPLKIVRNDITKVKADAIVNSANKNPICGGGAEYSIYEAAGREALLAEHVKQMIERQKQKYGWEFILLGANIELSKPQGTSASVRKKWASYIINNSPRITQNVKFYRVSVVDILCIIQNCYSTGFGHIPQHIHK
mgnify:CR=1 FL=1